MYSRRILSWSLSKSRTTELTCDALTYALRKRGYSRDVVSHTHRGIEYTGASFQKLLDEFGFKHSVNRPGHCTENAHMESFFMV
ncbi:MAG: DDE-type integrase/transposase/recombinase [Candidatus Thiodiazotropha sp. DIVDIV]